MDWRAMELEFESLTVHIALADDRIVNLAVSDNLTEEVLGSFPHRAVPLDQSSDQLEFDWNHKTVH
ncbi:MAG: hypothetical protein AAF697_03535 [Pseudomonadota bacterium]